MVYERRRGRGCRPRSIGRRTLGQAGDARCGARTAGARALWPRWQGGGASGRWKLGMCYNNFDALLPKFIR